MVDHEAQKIEPNSWRQANDRKWCASIGWRLLIQWNERCSLVVANRFDNNRLETRHWNVGTEAAVQMLNFGNGKIAEMPDVNSFGFADRSGWAIGPIGFDKAVLLWWTRGLLADRAIIKSEKQVVHLTVCSIQFYRKFYGSQERTDAWNFSYPSKCSSICETKKKVSNHFQIHPRRSALRAIGVQDTKAIY